MRFSANTVLWAGAVIALAAGLVLPNWLSFLVTVALAKGLVVLGLVLLMRAGLVSFGQGLYYGLGGYTVGILGQFTGTSNALVLLGAAALAGLGVAAVVGLLLSRYREIFFAMFSMAFSMILYGLLVKSAALGSSDGFNVVKPDLFGWAPQAGDGTLLTYWLAVGVALVAAWLMGRYFRAAMGYAGEAVRENEVRVEYLGISVQRVIYVKYLIAGVLAAIGGGITALAAGHIDPEMVYWTTSGEFVFIALVGGTANVAAPMIGAVLFELLRSYAFELAPYTWQLILGAALLAIILFLPKGLWSLTDKLKARMSP